jgi:hypothetical protein
LRIQLIAEHCEGDVRQIVPVLRIITFLRRGAKPE